LWAELTTKLDTTSILGRIRLGTWPVIGARQGRHVGCSCSSWFAERLVSGCAPLSPGGGVPVFFYSLAEAQRTGPNHFVLWRLWRRLTPNLTRYERRRRLMVILLGISAAATIVAVVTWIMIKLSKPGL
jgi:hypothetical protein